MQYESSWLHYQIRAIAGQAQPITARPRCVPCVVSDRWAGQCVVPSHWQTALSQMSKDKERHCPSSRRVVSHAVSLYEAFLCLHTPHNHTETKTSKTCHKHSHFQFYFFLQNYIFFICVLDITYTFQFMYSSPSLIRPPYLPRNCGHIRGVAFGEREKSIHLQ